MNPSTTTQVAVDVRPPHLTDHQPTDFVITIADGTEVEVIRGRPGTQSKPRKPRRELRRAAIVGRHSRDGGRSRREDAQDSFIAPQLDVDTCVRVARDRNIEIVQAAVFMDFTGAESERLEPYVRAIEAEVIDCIIVPSIARLGRGHKFIEVIERILDGGGDVIFADKDWDLTDPMARYIVNQMLLVYGLERDEKSAKWDAIHRWKVVEQGAVMHACFGYEKRAQAETIEGIRFAKGTLKPVDTEVPHIRHIAQRRLVGDPDGELAKYLNAQGFRTRPKRRADGTYAESRAWTGATVKYLLRNPQLKGTAKWGRHVKENAHPAILDPETWDRIQATYSPRAVPQNQNSADGLLELRCGGCRYVISYVGTLADGTKPSYSHPNVPECEANGGVRAHIIEPYIEELFVRHLTEEAAKNPQHDTRLQPAEQSVAQRLTELRAEQERLDAKVEERVADADRFERDPASYDALLAAARAAAHANQEQIATLEREVKTKHEAVDLLDKWPDMSTRSRRLAIKSVWPIIFVRKGLHVDENGVRRRRPLHERVLLVHANQAHKYELPTRGVSSYRVQPVDWPDGSRPALRGSTLRSKAPEHAFRSERFWDLSASTADGLAALEAARERYLAEGLTAQQLVDGVEACNGNLARAAATLGCPANGLSGRLRRARIELGLLDVDLVWEARKKRRRASGKPVPTEELIAAYELCDGNGRVTARMVGLDPSSVYERIRKLKANGTLAA